MRRIDAATLRGWITDGDELAVLDAREEGEFGQSHLFWAVPCPLSRWEQRAPVLLPRRTVRVVCVDDGRGVAERLASYLAGIGCTCVSVLDGGIASWEAAGFVLFSGVNVPSKAFGEWVEHHYGTESVDAPVLKTWIESGRDMVVLDSRTFEEFRRMSIPTGVSVPGGELVYRVGDLAPDPQTLVVVNCAGRTRSIMGAESLRQAGIPNQVVALRNGTMGWELAGLVCNRGLEDRFTPGRPDTASLAFSRAAAFAERSGVRVIDVVALAALQSDPARSLYLLDVRDPAEFAAGHRPGSTNAPGGQLVQATDAWIGVRHATIVVIDDDGVRARMSAGWLRQMGFAEVYVADNAVPGWITAADLHASDALVIDLDRSIAFREGHIPGARWGVRTRLDLLRSELAAAPRVVVTSPDGTHAALAVDEIRSLTTAEVSVLAGGTASWRQAGFPILQDRHVPADEACIDFHLRPYDRNSGIEAAMQEYLSWELDLVSEINRDGTVRFGV
jgi:rhodanese-related sulfurtransferase